jgi:hypothetical protein
MRKQKDWFQAESQKRDIFERPMRRQKPRQTYNLLISTRGRHPLVRRVIDLKSLRLILH